MAERKGQSDCFVRTWDLRTIDEAEVYAADMTDCELASVLFCRMRNDMRERVDMYEQRLAEAYQNVEV